MFRRVATVLLAFIAGLTLLGSTDSSTTRLDRIGHKLVCQCGCGQILMECNHVGCPVSGPMIEDLRAKLASQPGIAEAAVLDTFVSRYGPIVLAAPIRGGFDVVAWIVPFAALLLGGLVVVLVLRGWRRSEVAAQIGNPTVAPNDALRERIRQDTDTL